MATRSKMRNQAAVAPRRNAPRGSAASAGPAQSPSRSAQDYQTVALVLQGGGALGAYQCGVYEALREAAVEPSWFVGTSIGAINAAILAGNAPRHRVERLHEFWDTVCQPVGGPATLITGYVRALLAWYPNSQALSNWAHSMGALGALAVGQEGFFNVRTQSPFLYRDGSPKATSFYDTTPLRSTLERLVDFDRINAKGGARLTVGAVDLETGNDRYFDSAHEAIRPEHVMASGALPPAFPSVEVDGRHYWDGGVVSNTPLDRVWDDNPRHDSLVFQVDLWSAHGPLPNSMTDVFERQKDIRYSSRTRAHTDSGARLQKLRIAIDAALDALPKGALDNHALQTLRPWACTHVYNIIHLIYQSKPHEAQFKDYAFGIGTQREHWADGYADMVKTLQHPEFFVKPSREQGVVTHDIHRIMKESGERGMP